jgi:hypothetical protein
MPHPTLPVSDDPYKTIRLVNRVARRRGKTIRNLAGRLDETKQRMRCLVRRMNGREGMPAGIEHLAGEVSRMAAPGMIGPCVYFLLWGREVVYVGQSKDLHGRLCTHRRDNKLFDDVLYLPVTEHRLDEVERDLIKRLLPKLNRKTTW